MVDITLCNNGKCPLRERCKRGQDYPEDKMQSYARWEPRSTARIKHCDGYLPMWDGAA